MAEATADVEISAKARTDRGKVVFTKLSFGSFGGCSRLARESRLPSGPIVRLIRSPGISTRLFITVNAPTTIKAKVSAQRMKTRSPATEDKL